MNSLSVATDGSLYFVDHPFIPYAYPQPTKRLRRLRPDGIVEMVAASCPSCYATGTVSWSSFDNASSTLRAPSVLARAPQGGVYLCDMTRLLHIDAVAGIFETILGNATDNPYSPNIDYQCQGITSLDTVPDGTILQFGPGTTGVAGGGLLPPVRIGKPLFGSSGGGILVPDEGGRVVHAFSRTGRHLQTLDPVTGVALRTFGYDAAGRLASITERDGDVTQIVRGPNGSAAVLAPFGQRTTLVVDANHFLSSVTDPLGATWQMAYDSHGLMTKFTDANDNVHRMSYWPDGSLLRDENPDGLVQTLSRTDNATDWHSAISTTLGRTETHDAVSLGNDVTRRTFTDAAGLRTVRLQGGSHDSITTDPAGVVQTRSFGPDPQFGWNAPMEISSSIALPSGLLQTRTHSRTIQLNVGLASVPSSIVDQYATNRVSRRVTYRAAAAQTPATVVVQSSAGRTLNTTLDPKGRPASLSIPGLDLVTFTHDAHGRISSVLAGVRQTMWTYDANGYVASIRAADSSTVLFQENLRGELTGVSYPDGQRAMFSYDPDGNLRFLTPPGSATHEFRFGAGDLPSLYQAPIVSGGGTNAVSYVYDADAQLSAIQRPDGSTIDLTRDSAGRVILVSGPGVGVATSYDATTGNVSTVRETSGGEALAYGYDGFLKKHVAWSGDVNGALDRDYDAFFRLAAEHVNGDTVAFAYDPDGLLLSAGGESLTRDTNTGLLLATTIGSVADAYAYNSLGELSRFNASVLSTPLLSHSLTRDALGRIATLSETIQGESHLFAYGYDLRGRLASVDLDGGRSETYAYDANGNRVGADVHGVSTTSAYDAQDRLLQAGSTTFAYDAMGTLTSRTDGAGTTSYTYDAFGNLRHVGLPDGRAIDYVVDGAGRRVGKKINGALVAGYLYRNALKPVAELDATGAVRTRYVYGAKAHVPDYMIRGGTTYRIISDERGSVRLVVDVATGNVAQRIDYDAWGNVLRDSSPGFQICGFAGGVYDVDTGLVRFGARDYDARVGRWTAKDAIGFVGGPKFYAYGENAPVGASDLDGRVVVYGAPPFWSGWSGTLFGASADFAAQASASWGAGNCADAALDGSIAAATGLWGAVFQIDGPQSLADSAMLTATTWDKGGACPVGRFTEDQSAFVDPAKQAQRTGVTPQQADILRQWANETGLSSRGPEVHPGRPSGQRPHIHIGPVGHIPVNQ